MSDPPPRRVKAPLPDEDRRLPSGAAGWRKALRRLRGLLARPLRLRRRALDFEFVLVDRRRGPSRFEPPTVAMISEELRSRLLALDQEQIVAMRHLRQVHDALKRSGYGGLDNLSARALRKAREQVDMLTSAEPSPAMTLLLEKLELARVAAEVRDERRVQAERESAANVEVRETSFDEFMQSDRSPS
jgi:hypothetical protein